ncbi:MAG: PIN domain-containing protein [Candidatus Dormibacteria bacterium]
MIILPDTAVWVSFLRLGLNGPAAGLDRLLAGSAQLVTCGPVVAEILAGAPDTQRADLWPMLAGLPWVNLRTVDWRTVGDVSARLRQRGETVPLTDVEIAVAAVFSGAHLWSWDPDFDRVSGVMPELRRTTDSAVS